ncbi:LysR substrate-binding domain-containing protein [Ruegeria sp. WL0004]|uniref:LysR substrate-binding domain-containing protein n=1 Tax=Ruegeria marisflavi TaxID=2984152 RepID=A0ABT2WMI8_9RHOB|nr:LysR substrate-binding domain-containing protein [Ruegeria sp. WL0004]MCU9837107.1 LysR substrate-binding domain-containing protein [Ruegeria sp. WL0004]
MLAPRRFLPSISSLRALEALDRLGSASAVAEELSLTQSAVSRQLQTLETQMGVELIQRDRKRLSLTPAAQNYVAEIREALNRIAQASLRLQVTPVGGTVNLAILPTFGMRWLMPRLPEFARLHPDITINMSTRLRPFSFASEPFDAAIHFGEPDWPGTDRLLLKAERVLPVCAPQLLPHGAPKSPADLLRLPLLHIQTRPRAWQDWFTQMGVTYPDPLPGTLHDQFATISQAALHGLGVALLPQYVVEQDLATGRLIAAYPDAVETVGAYYLVWPRAKGADPSLRTFRHWLAGQAEPEETLPR